MSPNCSASSTLDCRPSSNRIASSGDALSAADDFDRPMCPSPVADLQEKEYLPVGFQMKKKLDSDKADVLQGTLILLVLRTLDVLGPMHGYGLARRIEQISGDLLQLNQGTLYPALLRMEQEKWILSKWGASEKNRRAKFYAITPAGRRQLAKTTDDWQRMSTTIERFLGSIADLAPEEGS
jgi:PadR family transcriptional regulator, regulatory protein PadR